MMGQFSQENLEKLLAVGPDGKNIQHIRTNTDWIHKFAVWTHGQEPLQIFSVGVKPSPRFLSSLRHTGL